MSFGAQRPSALRPRGARRAFRMALPPRSPLLRPLLLTVLCALVCGQSPSPAAWRSLSPLPLAISDAAVATVGGLVYLLGGCDSDQICIPDDPSRQPPNNGFCFCPSSTESVTVYNPALDRYGRAAAMPRPRYRHDACSIGSRIWIFGGRAIADDSIITAVDMFDASTGAWSANVATYPADLGSDNSCATLGSLIYLMGGYSASYDRAYNTTYRFDPATSSFTRMAGRMRQGRGDFSSIAAPGGVGGTVLRAWGGYTNASSTDSDPTGDWACRPLATSEVYDPVTDAWSAGPPLPMAIAEKDDGIDIGGVIYSVGGETKAQATACKYYDLTAVANVFALDTNAASPYWAAVAELPAPRMRSSSAFVNNTIFLFGGQGEFINGSTLQFFPLAYAAWALLVTPSLVPPVAGGGSSTNVGAIVGGVIGGLAGAALFAAAAVLLARRYGGCGGCSCGGGGGGGGGAAAASSGGGGAPIERTVSSLRYTKAQI